MSAARAKPIVTIAEIQAALQALHDDPVVLGEALEAGDRVLETGGSREAARNAGCEVFYRLVRERFDVRIPIEILEQRLAEIEEAKAAGVSIRRQ